MKVTSEQLNSVLRSAPAASVVPYDRARDKVVHLDLSPKNPGLKDSGITPPNGLQEFVDAEVERLGGTFGYGGYFERRELYGPSDHFGGAEPRNIHLGIDVWRPAGTAIYAPLAGKVHSFQYNPNFLDYGPTILLEHNLQGMKFLSLYGHLSMQSIEGLEEGKEIPAGAQIGALGDKTVNGNWPPHLHFQLIIDPQQWRGDYPGVSEQSKLDFYRGNCPDPALLLPWCRN